MSAVVFKGVCFSRPGREVLHHLDFSIEENSFVAVVGPNGGGKTTLLRLILGELKPAHGSVNVLGDAPTRVRRHVGYVPQHIDVDPFFPLSVRDAVLMGRLGNLKWRYTAADYQAAECALVQTGMLAAAEKSFARLSGGERQRVLIAQALASEPKLLLLDEPVANVDAEHAAALYELFSNLSAHMTVLMVSHNLAVVTRKATHVLCVNRTAGMHRLGDVASKTFQTAYGSVLAAIAHDNCAVAHEPGEGCLCAAE